MTGGRRDFLVDELQELRDLIKSGGGESDQNSAIFNQGLAKIKRIDPENININGKNISEAELSLVDYKGRSLIEYLFVQFDTDTFINILELIASKPEKKLTSVRLPFSIICELLAAKKLFEIFTLERMEIRFDFSTNEGLFLYNDLHTKKAKEYLESNVTELKSGKISASNLTLVKNRGREDLIKLLAVKGIKVIIDDNAMKLKYCIVLGNEQQSFANLEAYIVKRNYIDKEMLRDFIAEVLVNHTELIDLNGKLTDKIFLELLKYKIPAIISLLIKLDLINSNIISRNEPGQEHLSSYVAKKVKDEATVKVLLDAGLKFNYQALVDVICLNYYNQVEMFINLLNSYNTDFNAYSPEASDKKETQPDTILDFIFKEYFPYNPVMPYPRKEFTERRIELLARNGANLYKLESKNTEHGGAVEKFISRGLRYKLLLNALKITFKEFDRSKIQFDNSSTASAQRLPLQFSIFWELVSTIEHFRNIFIKSDHFSSSSEIVNFARGFGKEFYKQFRDNVLTEFKNDKNLSETFRGEIVLEDNRKNIGVQRYIGEYTYTHKLLNYFRGHLMDRFQNILNIMENKGLKIEQGQSLKISDGIPFAPHHRGFVANFNEVSAVAKSLVIGEDPVVARSLLLDSDFQSKNKQTMLYKFDDLCEKVKSLEAYLADNDKAETLIKTVEKVVEIAKDEKQDSNQRERRGSIVQRLFGKDGSTGQIGRGAS